MKYIHKEYGFMSAEKRDRIISFLQTTEDKNVAKYKSDLTLNVPYRLQVPFYDEIRIERNMWNGSKKNLTDEINRQQRLMYYFVLVSGINTEIEINESWYDYLYRHKEILRGWVQLKLIKYLQNKNPNVPGIADKIEPPISRNIDRVRKYWKLIIEVDPTLKDIYSKSLLSDANSISIDHFVPWQYVAHDELWNLHPTTKSINSSKSNSLPSWNIYFNTFGDIEYRAYELKENNEAVSNEFNKIAPYHLNNQEVMNQLYADGLDRNSFIERLEHVVKPVYESAQSLGFKEWVYDGNEDITE